jgi:Uri superfamily endonuclease
MALKESDVKEIIFSAVFESGNEPLAAGTAKFEQNDPRLRWHVDYETRGGEARNVKIFTDYESTPESVAEEVKKAIDFDIKNIGDKEN